MKKLVIAVIIYFIAMVCSIVYCGGIPNNVLEIIMQTLIFAIFMYSYVLIAKLLKFLGIADYFMNIANGSLCYTIYIVFVGMLMVSLFMLIQLFKTKKLIYAISYLPLITSYHACTLFCKEMKSIK